MRSRFRPICLAALVAGVLLTFPAQAQQGGAALAFQYGNERYVLGDYHAALIAYQQAEATGYVSGPLFYNMGSTFHRLGELGQAIRYYEKARRLMPDSHNLLHNLDLAREEAGGGFAPPVSVWTTWQQRLAAIGVRLLFGIGLGLYLIAMGIAGYRVWTGHRNAWLRRGLALSLTLGLLLIGLAYATSLGAASNRHAVVVVDRAAVRHSPSVSADAEADVREGMLLDVLGRRAGWLEVRLPDGEQGWVEAEHVGEV
ncbi:MAG: SH3 domain-containing protein [Rhodothermales bacterium]